MPLTKRTKRANMQWAMMTAIVASFPIVSHADWKIGFSKAIITPTESTWLSGYANRTKPATGKIHDLYAKAAAFEDGGGTRFVLVTLDLGSVNSEMTANVARRVHEQFKLSRGNLVLNCSHTHCAPEVAFEREIFHDLSRAEADKLNRYIDRTNDTIVELIGKALADLQPVQLTLSESTTDFAVNRRGPNGVNEAGVTDRRVPVLCASAADGKLRGIIFGYACHNTTLNIQQYCGDYAGFAQYELEQRHPGAVAMFVMGCGGDQNPHPRRELKLAEQHGKSLADAVDIAVAGKRKLMQGDFRIAYGIAALNLEPLVPEKLRADSLKPRSDVAARKARFLLTKIDAGQEVPLTQECPLHVVRLGNELLMIFISGETVVDYSLRCKSEFAGPYVWVAGYCDDVFAYLPSRRVLLEGGYEGREAVVHQRMATPFLPNVEDNVMAEIHKLVHQVSRPH